MAVLTSRGTQAGKLAYRDLMKSKKRKMQSLAPESGDNPMQFPHAVESCCAEKNQGVLVDTKLNISHHSARAAKVAHGTLGMHCQQAKGQHPEESYKDSEGTRGEVTHRVAEVTWLVQPGQD